MLPWTTWNALTARLAGAGSWAPNLFIRLILGWEFWESGAEKLGAENWFGSIPYADWQRGFPSPFDVAPVELSWFLATWFELVGAVALLLGLFTRFFALALVVVTAVAAAAVHVPAEFGSLAGLWEGYRISSRDGSGNFKLPLLFIVLLLPLVFDGAGRLSLDALLRRLFRHPAPTPVADRASFGLALAVVGLSLVFVFPLVGAVGLIVGAGLALPTLLAGRGSGRQETVAGPRP